MFNAIDLVNRLYCKHDIMVKKGKVKKSKLLKVYKKLMQYILNEI